MSPVSAELHYEVLGVSRAAKFEEIRLAYRMKALKHHPDKDSSESATAHFQRIQAAWEVLGSSCRRFLYDSNAENDAARRQAANDQDLTRTLTQRRIMRASKENKTMDLMKALRASNTSEVNAFDESGCTALMFAAQAHLVQVVSLLIVYRADVNLADSVGWTPLLFAATSAQDSMEGGDVEGCFRALLNAKANPNARSNTGATPLLLACAAGHLPATCALLDHGADPAPADESGATALALAAEGGHAEVVAVLLRAGAPVDARDSAGRTALMAACSLARSTVVATLLEAGADAGLKAEDGSTALSCVVECMRVEDSTASHVDASTRVGATEVISLLAAAGAPLEEDEEANSEESDEAAALLREEFAAGGA